MYTKHQADRQVYNFITQFENLKQTKSMFPA